jgi:PAS domain S-box-containing protein
VQEDITMDSGDRDVQRTARAARAQNPPARPRATEALRQSEERFRLLVESVQDYAIFMLDPDGYIQGWNEGARRIKGYTHDEIVGQHFSIFYTPEDLAKGIPSRNLDRAEKEGRWEDEGWRVRKDGTRFWADVVITALRDETGQLVGFGKVTRDLTERRRAIDLRIELIREQEARAAAEKAVELRDEFMSIAAHELKTPVTSLQMQVQVALRRLTMGALDPKRLDRTFRVIEDQSHKLGTLIEQLLDVSRIANGRLALEFAEIDLVPIFDAVVERMRALSSQHRIVLAAPERLVARVDPLRLEQVLSNLLSNAIKYSPDGVIEVALSAADGGALVFSVRDHGPGIPPERRAHIFDRFYQADSRSHRSGLGLGLYISREIVRLHAGEIHPEFPPDGGTRFVVTLPLAFALQESG